MKYKDTMESPWGVLKLTVLKSGPKLIGDFSFPATCWWGPHPQRLGHGRASLRNHRHRCSWHRKFHSLTSMFFLMNHDPYHPYLVYLPTFIGPWMVWVMNILNYSIPNPTFQVTGWSFVTWRLPQEPQRSHGTVNLINKYTIPDKECMALFDFL